MASPDPVYGLRADLEAARLRAVEAMTASGSPSPDALRELATLQMALMAVRESIDEAGAAFEPRRDEQELENAALGLIAKE